MTPVMSSGATAWVRAHVGEVTGTRALTGGMTSTMLAMDSAKAGPVVLRVIDREPWRTHGVELATRESEIQAMLGETAVPSPRSLALDATGEHCGDAGHLMTLVPGRLVHDPVGGGMLDELARVLATIHEVTPTVEVREYQSWAWEAKHVVPGWARCPSDWEDAFALLRTEPPAYEACFIHRDFQPRNVLWEGDRVAGVVDWVEASAGPAWLDVAHCATNLAIRHGGEVSDAFADAYVARTGLTPQPYFDVMDVVGFLPPPGKSSFFAADVPVQRRLEDRLVAVLGRARTSA